MNSDQLDKEFEAFMDWPTDDKSSVTSVSAKLFAQHWAERQDRAKWTEFDPADKNTYPDPFTWVMTEQGIAMHCYLSDSDEDKDRTYDHWCVLAKNRDQIEYGTGYMGLVDEEDDIREIKRWCSLPKPPGEVKTTGKPNERSSYEPINRST